MAINSLSLISPKQRHGEAYEKVAAEFLQQQGLQLIAKNWQQPGIGEIDLILIEPGPSWDILVFAEVRKRKLSGYGDALMSITKSKQKKLIKAAQCFLLQHPQYAKFECRFDVVAFNEGIKKNSRNTSAPQADKKQDTGLLDNVMPQWIQSAFIAPAW